MKFRVIGSFFRGKLLIEGNSYMSFTPATHDDSVEILFSVIIFAQVDNRDIEY